MIFIARTLDRYADTDYTSLIVKDGVCTDRKEKANIMGASSNEEYFHGELIETDNGLVDFKPLSYRADPYPMNDIIFSDAFEHVAEGKIWAIAKDKSGNCHVMYKNDVTHGRFVYQNVTQNQSYDDRIKGKLDKGYVATNAMRYFANARAFVKQTP